MEETVSGLMKFLKWINPCVLKKSSCSGVNCSDKVKVGYDVAMCKNLKDLGKG
jgi:hypothetical protein